MRPPHSLLAGADVVMAASVLLRHGAEQAPVLFDGLAGWTQRKGFATVEAVRGLLAIPQGADEAARKCEDRVIAEAAWRA